MKRVLFVFVAAVGLGACTFPQTTKMEPVGETQMQTSSPNAAPAADQSKEANKKAGSSTNSTM